MRISVGDLRRGRPDVLQVDRLAVLAHAERLARDVDLERAGERIGDDERRRGEIVRAHVRIDAALEVAVAGKHRAGDEVVLVDRLGDRLRQRPGIADAGRAAIADEVEAERVEMLLQPGLLQIFGHHLRARRERGLHPGLRLQALLVRLLGEQAGADQHARVGGVGAGGDRRDDDMAVGDLVVACSATLRLLRPRRRGSPCSAFGEFRRGRGGERHAVLRALRAGERGHDGAEIELQRVGEDRVGRVVDPPHALRLGIGLDQRDAVGIAAGRGQVGDRVVARSGRGRRSRRIPAPCCRSSRGPRRSGSTGPARRTRRTCRPRPSCAASA